MNFTPVVRIAPRFSPASTSALRCRQQRFKSTTPTDGGSRGCNSISEKNAATRSSTNSSIEGFSAVPDSSISTISPAGAATAPLAKATTRSLLEAIRSSPIGRLARLYARHQERRPYVTQLYTVLVVYLCGDLVAQLLFPTEGRDTIVSQQGNRHESQSALGDPDQSKKGFFGEYDFLRTFRHVTTGVLFAIPAYEW
jgi:hypothetical protein